MYLGIIYHKHGRLCDAFSKSIEIAYYIFAFDTSLFLMGYEVFSITDEIQQLILQRATATEIQKLAIQQGMVTMREDGYLKALDGFTTLSEVNRVAAAENA